MYEMMTRQACFITAHTNNFLSPDFKTRCEWFPGVSAAMTRRTCRCTWTCTRCKVTYIKQVGLVSLTEQSLCWHVLQLLP